MIRDLGDGVGRREAGGGKTGDPRSLEPVMLLAWSVSTDPPLQATASPERHEEGLPPITAFVWCGAAAAAQEAMGWAPSLSPHVAVHHFELSE